MCIKIVERYSVCRCIYYSHAVDACPYYGSRGHAIKTQQVLVGYSCRQHTVNKNSKNRIGNADGLSVEPAESEAGHALDRPEDLQDTNEGIVLDGKEDRLTGSAVDGAIDSSLRGQLMAKCQKVFDTDEQFIPAGDLHEVLTIHAIEAELQFHGLEYLSSFVFQRAKRIFAILLVIRKLDTLEIWSKEGLGDELLPLADSTFDSLDNEMLRTTFSKWDIDTQKQFFEIQWTLLAPVFSNEEHLKLHADARLPLINTDEIARGSDGAVFHVEIHPDHETFEKLTSPMSQKGHVYALKQISQGTADVNQRAFDREMAVLRSIRSSGHHHIIKHLATFEQRGRYFMILPLAEENLRQLWTRASPSSFTSHWFFQQMSGLANALAYLHNDLLAQGSRPLNGYHMDLKPENILILRDSSTIHGRWIISDFGASYLHLKESRQELPPHPGLGTYEPPECQLNLPQTQAYDVWSLGCIFLECAIWLIKGSGAVDTFAADRLNDVEISGNNFKDDYFFALEFNESSTPVGAMTRPAVIKWIRDLERDPTCREEVHGLLHLIEHGLLQVDQSKRLKADKVRQEVDIIHQTAKGFLASLASGPHSTSQATTKARITEIED